MPIVTPTSDAGRAKEGEQVHNINRMPGFAAEASLYSAGNPYWLRGQVPSNWAERVTLPTISTKPV